MSSGSRNFLDRLNEKIGLIAGVAVFIIVTVTLYEVLVRYVFNSPTGWSLQFSGYFLLTATFLSFSYTLQQDGHVRVDIVLQRLPKGIRNILLLVGYIMGLVFCAVLTWQVGLLTFRAYQGGWYSAHLIGVPLGPIYTVMPVGGLVLCVTFIAVIYTYTKRIFG